MKKLILILLLVCNASLFAGEAEDLMESANNLYQQQKYDDAIKVYNDIINAGYVSETLFYNLGNAYYRFGQLGYAILSYERALKISPNSEDVKYNLAIINARTVDKIKDVPKLFLLEWWESLITSLSMTSWSILVIIFYLLLLISLSLYLTGKTGRTQRIGFLYGSGSLAVLAITVILFAAHYNRETSSEFGILINQEFAVKQSPSTGSDDVFVIHEGLKFAIEDRVNDWTRIKLSDGKVGWLLNNTFEII